MAYVSGTAGSVAYVSGGTTVVTGVHEWSIDVGQETPETTAFGDQWRTYVAGIRDWTGMLPLAPGDPEALTLILRQRGLNIVPGEEWSYSNSGFVLLKEIVARVSGMSFDDFTRKRLFDTLGMKSTAHRSDLRAVIKNRALAYDREDGRWKIIAASTARNSKTPLRP